MANRLANETSPYLLQHKDNPVDWWPWCDEALELARAEDKPILLSVGYAACHWCHVMAHESFEDAATADAMNSNFVCIKVDREERPDIDALYMEAVQAMTGHGGWPMTVFLTPGGEPFYGGTYFPPVQMHGLPAFRTLLDAIADTWKNKRGEVESQGKMLTEHVHALTKTSSGAETIDSHVLDHAGDELLAAFDPDFAGFSGAPKFPQPMLVDLCARLHARGRDELGVVAQATLDAMAAGGMFDQLGGGFHRYSVDRSWTVPHFEKMLYDNAQLLRTYARSWQRTRDERHRDVAVATAEWMLREMRDDNGGFYSSLDADSEGEEGRYYVWDLDEVTRLLGDLAPFAIEEWGFSREGNFEGRNIPVRARRTNDASVEIDKAREILLEARERRIRPATDTKILAAWNGLAAAALAEAGAILDRPTWVTAARQAMTFVMTTMSPHGRIHRSWGRDAAGADRLGPLGFCDDYAFTLEAALVLFETTADMTWLKHARRIADDAIELFWDDTDGAFFSTGSDQERLILRRKDMIDNAIPSANSALALELQRLATLTGNRSYEDRAEETMRPVIEVAGRAPLAFGNLLAAVDYYTSEPKEIVIVAEGDVSDVLRTIRSTFVPNRVVVSVGSADVDTVQDDIPLVRGRTAIDGRPTIYVCRRGVCDLPITDIDTLQQRLTAA